MKVIKIVKLTAFLLLAVFIDVMLYAFTKTCVSCSTFSEFLASAHSLAGPVIVSLGELVHIRFVNRKK